MTPSAREYALLEEYSFIRREAQAEADLAYDAWCRYPGRDRYAVYRAAQDGLATWVRSTQHVPRRRGGEA